MVIYSKLWMNDAEGPIDVNFGISFLIGCIYVYMLSCSVMFDFLWPHGLYTAKLPCPWDSPSKNTAVGSHLLLQEEETQELNPGTDSGTESRDWLRNWIQVFCTAGRFFTIWASREAHSLIY